MSSPWSEEVVRIMGSSDQITCSVAECWYELRLCDLHDTHSEQKKVNLFLLFQFSSKLFILKLLPRHLEYLRTMKEL